MFTLKGYKPHPGQETFHHAVANMFRFTALIAGIRGGKTVGGAREAVRQAWNATGKGVFGIIAPTYNMLDRTTWIEFREAARPLIQSENESKKVITFQNGRRVHGHSADKADRIRNETFVGFWVDEARECKAFGKLWDILLGRVLSTGGKGFITTTPNGYDSIYDVFVQNKKKEYGMVKFSTRVNTNIPDGAIDELEGMYDEKYAKQELYGEFIVFAGQVYYAFNRLHNAGDLAFKVAQYNSNSPLELCADFNVDPLAWVICQKGIDPQSKLPELYVIDEIYLRNSNTEEGCREFKLRYPNHNASVHLYGDATGNARSTTSNVTNWKIIDNELAGYRLVRHIRTANPAERDRVNAMNGMICNSKGQRRVFVNPQKCKHTIKDLEQVAYKEGSVQIDKTKDLELTHASDAFGYRVEKEFSLNRNRIEGLKI